MGERRLGERRLDVRNLNVHGPIDRLASVQRRRRADAVDEYLKQEAAGQVHRILYREERAVGRRGVASARHGEAVVHHVEHSRRLRERRLRKWVRLVRRLRKRRLGEGGHLDRELRAG